MTSLSDRSLSDGDNAGPSNSDQWALPNPLPRSKRGCTTCRRRKVKCDEQRPRCGHCTRLERHCDWERRYRFHELSNHIHEKYHTVGLSSPTAPVTSSRKWQEMIANRQPPQLHDMNLTHSKSSSNEDPEEQKALSHAPGVYYLVHTPGTLAKQLEHEEMVQAQVSRQRYRQKILFATDVETDVPTRNVSQWCQDMKFSQQRDDYIFQMKTPSPLQSTIHLDHGVRAGDESKLLEVYQKEVCQRIMPFPVKFSLHLQSNGEDIVVAMAKDFPPLHHAICAVTLLSLGVRGRPHLITGAFSHYHRAISGCAQYSPSDIASSRFFFTHYLLLLHDTCCMCYGYPFEASVASLHYTQLYEIARSQPKNTWAPLQISISWKFLLSDAQTCLAGAKGAGAYVRAFQANRSAFPDQATMDHNTAITLETTHKTCQLVYFLYQFIAELGPWAVDVREAFNDGRITSAEIEAQIQMLLRRAEDMSGDASPLQAENSRTSNTTTSSMTGTLSDFFQLEYAATRLYLLTSVYPTQCLRPTHRHEEVAQLCTFILSWTSDAVINKKTEYFRLHALFLAGCTTKDEAQKSIAIELFRAMEASPVSFNARNSKKILELLYAEQRRVCSVGGSQEQVDWKGFVRQEGEDGFTYFSM